MENQLLVPSPAGTLRLLAREDAVTGLYFAGDAPADSRLEGGSLLCRCAQQLEEYFAGRRREFDLPLSPKGTPFQMRVWEALRRIPYGATWSYRELAEAVGCPRGYRAVGMANNRNPIPILIPCHRVIGADGSLTGYGGGLHVKVLLLELEKTMGNPAGKFRFS